MTIYPMNGRAPYYTNCYLVIGDAPAADGKRAAVLVDASLTPQQVQLQLDKFDASLYAILLTHGHHDHVEQLAELRKAFNAPVWLAQADQVQFGLDAENVYTEETLAFGDLSLQPMATPGHTPGSTCLVCGKVLFAGDTLFAGSVGRTDLPGGDGAVLCATLARMAQLLSPELQILPGHGDFSTMAQEKLSNPYLRYAQRNPQGSF